MIEGDGEMRPSGRKNSAAEAQRRALYLLVALAFALHNMEEAIAAPRMLELMQSNAPAFLRAFYAGIEVLELRISLVILTALGVVTTLIAARSPAGPGSSYVMLVFAALIGLNALAHVALVLVFRAYMPGLLTALLLTLPTSIFILVRGRRESWVSPTAYLTVFPAAVVVHGPVLAGFIRASIAVLTSQADLNIVLVAAIHAQPLETSPQPESCLRQRGAHSRMSIVVPLRHHGALLGSGPWCTQRRFDDDSQ